ncbi:hypothetical protein G6F42_019635 [Rhizopus arrhizus]|nr:hypothetical protein G6F42_019635 [Rhizopus arrhizus]
MLPTSTEQPRRLAVHFSIFECGNIAKLDGYVSNHGFTKIYNSWCLQRGGFKENFLLLDASVYNMLHVIYRNACKHTMDRLCTDASLELQMVCYAWHGVERKFVAMDGRFYWKRHHDRNKNKLAVEEGIFAPFAEVKNFVALAKEVERFSDETEVKDKE